MPSMLLVLALPFGVAAHGRMTIPPNRVGGKTSIAGTNDNCQIGTNKGLANGKSLSTNHNTCGYQNRDTGFSGKPTNCACRGMTGNLLSSCSSTGDCSKVSGSAWKMPWAAPGKSSVWAPCGVNGGRPKNDGKYDEPRDGRDLPVSITTARWVIGQSMEVAFAITYAHGGGYQWRLCPGSSATSKPSNDCFQPLEFTNSKTVVRWTNGKEQSYTPIEVTGSAVTPANKPWRVIRIPIEKDGKWRTDIPCGGCYGKMTKGAEIKQLWTFSLVDKVKVPNVKTGHAWLQWRWDNEQQDQVWTNCADVEIVSGAPTPAPKASNSQMVENSVLQANEMLVSDAGTAQLKMQGDGNLVLRDIRTDRSLWSTGTSGANAFFRFESGLVVVRSASKDRLWQACCGVYGPVRAKLQDDCNFVIRDSKDDSVWSTGTVCDSFQQNITISV